MTTMRERVENLGIDLEVTDGPNLERDESGWEHHAYTVTLTYADRGDEGTPTGFLTVPWRQGLGITDDPDAVSVLDALASDAATVENARSFEEWADELGYDPDSRKAERIYRQVEEQAAALRDFLGEDFDSVVWETDRL